MRFALYLFFFFLNVAYVFAQNPAYTEKTVWPWELNLPYNFNEGIYHWEDNPKLHQLTPEEQQMDNVIVLERVIVNTMEVMKQSYTLHRIVRVNSDKAISKHNRIYIQMTGVEGDVKFQARFISPSGKIVNTSNDNIKYIENYENHGPFKVAAIDGLEVGGEVEYFYTVIRRSHYCGTHYLDKSAYYKSFNMVAAISNSSSLFTELNSINKLSAVYLKVYNTNYEISKTKLDSAKKMSFVLNTIEIKQVSLNNIKPIKYEAFSADDACAIRIEFYHLYIYQSRELYSRYVYGNHKKSAIKGLQKKYLLKGKTVFETVTNIDAFIKSHFVYTEDRADKYRQIPDILRTKNLNEEGAIRLFIAFLTVNDIEFEIGTTVSRFRKEYDPELVYYASMAEKILIYIPAVRKEFDPADYKAAKGLIDESYISTKCHYYSVNLKDGCLGASVLISKNSLDTSFASSHVTADVELLPDSQETRIHLKQSFTKYTASNFQPYYWRLGDDAKKIMTDGIIHYLVDGGEITNTVISGAEANDLYVNPFVVESDVKSNTLIEKAGTKYLFKIGCLIGKQSDLYQESERKTPVENRFNRTYTRIIRFDIPDGYQISNLDKLKMDVNSTDSTGKMTMQFVSTYTVDSNSVTVTVKEFYNEIRLPVARYEEFRKVINAAADFNKIVLFLEKK